MRRTLTMLALAVAFALPTAGVALGDSERQTTTTTTTQTEPTGRLVITDAATRSFRVGTEQKVYVAPPDVDIAALSGQDVRVFVAPDGRVSRVTRSTTTTVDED
jgi:hypothetical protein